MYTLLCVFCVMIYFPKSGALAQSTRMPERRHVCYAWTYTMRAMRSMRCGFIIASRDVRIAQQAREPLRNSCNEVLANQ